MKSLTILIIYLFYPLIMADESPALKAQASKKTIIRIGYNIVPPYSIQKDGKAAGPANDYLRRIFKNTRIKPIFQHMSLARMISSLRDNHIDMINLMTYGAQMKGITRANESYDFFIPGVLVKKDFKLKEIATSSDLYKVRIATKKGMPMLPIMKDSKLDITYVTALNALGRSLMMLEKDRVDMVWSNSHEELIYMAKNRGIFNKFKALLLPERPIPIGVLFSKNGAKKFKKIYDEINSELLKKDVYKDLF